MPKPKPKLELLPDPVFLQRARMDPRWASATIDELRRMLQLLVGQIDMPANDTRTFMIFRRGTCMSEARDMVAKLESEVLPQRAREA